MGIITSDDETIMVVDDSDDIRELVCMWLRGAGYRVVEATNGFEAVALAPRTYPSLILMDLGMPVMDGYEATRRIKALPSCSRVPVVAVSAYCDPGDQRKALEAGCVECVSKPVDLQGIDRLISRHLHH